MRFAQFYVPAIVSFGLISACYTNLAFVVTHRREVRDAQADAGDAAATRRLPDRHGRSTR